MTSGPCSRGLKVGRAGPVTLCVRWSAAARSLDMNPSDTPTYPFYATTRRSRAEAYPSVDEFARYWSDARGSGSSNHHKAATCFCDFVTERGRRVEEFRQADVIDFVSAQREFYQLATMSSLASCLRHFFRFMFASGAIAEDRSAWVRAPRVFAGHRDPRHASPRDIAKLLGAIDKRGVEGARRFAVLMLLASYGLRAGEVARLAIDQIKWRAGHLEIINRKSKDAIVLPLMPQVAEALVAYLRCRPRSSSRSVFLTLTTPPRPITSARISIIARGALDRAGVIVARPGSHTFRYSTAQALFEAERPLYEIAEVLGHRDLRTTLRYLQITTHPLREVALNDGEELS